MIEDTRIVSLAVNRNTYITVENCQLVPPPADEWMEGWMREFYVTLAKVRPNKKAGITVVRRMAFATRMKIMSNMAAPRLKPGPEDRGPE